MVQQSIMPTGSGTSLRSSQATTFDSLRARLTNSQTQLINQRAPFDDRTYHSRWDIRNILYLVFDINMARQTLQQTPVVTRHFYDNWKIRQQHPQQRPARHKRPCSCDPNRSSSLIYWNTTRTCRML